MSNEIFDEDFYDPTVKELAGWIKKDAVPDETREKVVDILQDALAKLREAS